MLNRKNALFAGHDQGAENWAAIASLVETCKLHGVDPQAYFADVLTKLVNLWPASRLDELMPWAWAARRSTDASRREPRARNGFALAPSKNQAVRAVGSENRLLSIGAFFGLTPRRYQSGETDRVGAISRAGDPAARLALFEAAHVIMTRVAKW